MILSDEELEKFWLASTSTLPIVIIGGGRWGRTWSNAISLARGSCKGVTIVSKTDISSTTHWAIKESGFPSLSVVGNLSEAMNQTEIPAIAIIASRPRDHFRDAIEAIDYGLDVLIEKPISDRIDFGLQLISAAINKKIHIAVATEFAFLPAFHFCAKKMELSNESRPIIRLYWSDVINELWRGSVKNRHDEISVLTDLLPHAHSIFRIFTRGRDLHLESVIEEINIEKGWIHFCDDIGGRYEFYCNKQDTSRKRALEIETSDLNISVQFETELPKVRVNGLEIYSHSLIYMNSTLRLELGAFLLQRSDLILKTPINCYVYQLLKLQLDLQEKLKKG